MFSLLQQLLTQTGKLFLFWHIGATSSSSVSMTAKNLQESVGSEDKRKRTGRKSRLSGGGDLGDGGCEDWRPSKNLPGLFIYALSHKVTTLFSLYYEFQFFLIDSWILSSAFLVSAFINMREFV